MGQNGIIPHQIYQIKKHVIIFLFYLIMLICIIIFNDYNFKEKFMNSIAFVTTANGVSSVTSVLSDQTNKIYLAKAARNSCAGVEFAATGVLCYQRYQDSSLLNPFSNQDSFNPWSDKSAWFTKEHFNCIKNDVILIENINNRFL